MRSQYVVSYVNDLILTFKFRRYKESITECVAWLVLPYILGHFTFLPIFLEFVGMTTHLLSIEHTDWLKRGYCYKTIYQRKRTNNHFGRCANCNDVPSNIDKHYESYNCAKSLMKCVWIYLALQCHRLQEQWFTQVMDAWCVISNCWFLPNKEMKECVLFQKMYYRVNIHECVD